MKLTPMLASDTTAAFLGFVVLCVIIAATAMGPVLGGVAIAVNRKVSKAQLGRIKPCNFTLIFSLPALALSILIYKAPTVAGFPNAVLIPISAIPMVCAVYAWVLWRRAPRN